MIKETYAVLRLEDEEILRKYKTAPTLPVLLAVQERIWKLYLDRDSDLNKFTHAVNSTRLEDLPEELHAPQFMLKQFCYNLYTKTSRIRELERMAEVHALGTDKALRTLLTFLARKNKFSREEIARHLEHRYHLHVFDRCIEDEYIRAMTYTVSDQADTMYYMTWKAKALISDWVRYDSYQKSDRTGD